MEIQFLSILGFLINVASIISIDLESRTEAVNGEVTRAVRIVCRDEQEYVFDGGHGDSLRAFYKGEFWAENSAGGVRHYWTHGADGKPEEMFVSDNTANGVRSFFPIVFQTKQNV